MSNVKISNQKPIHHEQFPLCVPSNNYKYRAKSIADIDPKDPNVSKSR